jgi:prepilin-type N-terminal cleavage/methylation domain-containing protein
MQINTHVRQKKRPPAGFTLVEVIITLVVIAIAAALASPAFLAMAPEMQLRGAAQDLYSSTQEAKILAIKENRSVTLTYGSAGYTLGEPFTDSDGDGLYDSGAGDVFTPATHDTNNDGVFTTEKVVIFAVDYPNYGLGLGSGGAANNWSTPPSAIPSPHPAGSITFNSRGTTGNESSIYIDYVKNPNSIPPEKSDVCYAITTLVAGSVQIRKFNGTDWIQ